MSFGIGNNKISLNSVTLEDLTKGLDPQKDKKKIEQIKVAFDFFNKPGADGKKDDSLSYEEQIAMFNFMNKADGAAFDRDGKITRSGLRHVAKENGIEGTPKYKEYKSFIEAYQNAVAEMSPADTAEITYGRNKDGEFAQAKFTDESGLRNEEIYTTDVENPKYNSGVKKDAQGNTFRYDDKARVIQQNVGGVRTQYVQFSGENADATPTIVKQGGLTFNLDANFDDAGLYISEEGGKIQAARMNSAGSLVPVEMDDAGRITHETINEVGFSYTYEGENEDPSTIITSKQVDGKTETKTYTKEGELYSTGDAGNKQYSKFDYKTHEFTPAQSPEPAKPEIVKPHYQRGDRVHQTATWKNQRLGEEKAQKLGLNDLNTAEEALDKIISADENLKDKNINKAKLLADFIKNNPSVFVRSGESQGVIFSDAKWGRLDFPKDLSEYITE